MNSNCSINKRGGDFSIRIFFDEAPLILRLLTDALPELIIHEVAMQTFPDSINLTTVLDSPHISAVRMTMSDAGMRIRDE